MPKKQKSGLYRTKIKIGVGPDGKDIVKWISGRTKAELEAARREVVAYYIDGVNTNRDMLFGRYVAESWFPARQANARSVTVENYRTNLNTHVLPAFGNRHLRAISADDIRRWLNSYSGHSASQIDKLYMIIRSIFRTAFADGLVPRDPTAGLTKPKAAKKISRRALTNNETIAVLRAISSCENGRFLATLYYLGLRRGEALGLQWRDFDWDSGMVRILRDVVYVRGKTTISDLKTAAADRVVIMPKVYMDLMRPVQAAEDQFVFASKGNQPLCATSYKRLWMQLMGAAGLVGAKTPTNAARRKMDSGSRHLELMDVYEPTITAHYLRHNYVTKMFYAGMDPVLTMWLVGHESYETTIDIYTHLRKTPAHEKPMDMEWAFEVKRNAQKLHRVAEVEAES